MISIIIMHFGVELPFALLCSFKELFTYHEYAGLFDVPTHREGVIFSAHNETNNVDSSNAISYGFGDLILQSKVESRVEFGDTTTGRDGTNLNSVSVERCDDTATTCFVEAGGVVEVPMRADKLSIARYSSDVTIAEFLRRPMLIQNLTWSTSDSTGTIFNSYPPDDFLRAVSTFPAVTDAWYQKLKGFNLMRGTFVMRVELNASPFMGGALLASWMPQTLFGVSAARPTSLIGAYQLPHVVVSTRDTAAEIRVPFISPFGYYQQGHTLDNDVWGRISLIVASQLTVGPSAPISSCDVSVYGYWEDVELAAPIVPQAKTTHESLMPGKTISGSMKKVAKVAGAFKDVPVISGIASSVEWAANLAGGVASALGFSNPVLNINPALMVPRIQPYAHISDGPVTTLPMSTVMDAAVTVDTDHTITQEDEMSLEFLKRVPTYMGEIVWNTTSPSGTVLLSKRIYPRMLASVTTDSSYSPPMVYSHGGPLNYCSHLFTMWRGSLVLHLKFIKTAFHTGRIQIIWSPTEESLVTAPTISNSMYALRHILDIRDQDEYTVNLPYLLRSQYLPTDVGTNVLYASGTLTISVLNELRAPETCAASIRLLEFYTGGPDLEFQAPGAFEPEPLRLQASTHYFERNEPARSLAPSEKCISESVTSLRQLTSKASLCTSSTSVGATGRSLVVIDPYHIGVTYANGPSGTPNVLRGNLDTVSLVGSMYAYQSGSMDLYFDNNSTAGVPYSVACVPGLLQKLAASYPTVAYNYATVFNPAVGDKVLRLIPPQASGMTSTVPFSNMAASPYLPILSTGNVNGFGVHVHYISKYPASMVFPAYNRNTAGGFPDPDITPVSTQSVVLNVSNSDAATKSIIFRRSTGDDHRFKMFIGCPPLLLSLHSS